MNLKVTNLIAIQFGMFVGIMAWLAYSRIPSTAPRSNEPRLAAAEMQESALSAGANVAAVVQPKNPRPEPANYNADREEAQPVKEKRPDWETVYYQSIAPKPYPKPAVETRFVAVNPPSSSRANLESADVPADDLTAPETVAYPQPVQNVFYAQPIQNVVFSDPRPFNNQCRPAPRRHIAPLPNPRPRLNVLSAGSSGCRVLSQASAGTPADGPTRGVRPWGRR